MDSILFDIGTMTMKHGARIVKIGSRSFFDRACDLMECLFGAVLGRSKKIFSAMS
jgi:hypothetical protein